MDLPPAYYTTADALQAENRDLATAIRQLSNETIRTDDQFQTVYVALKREEMFDESPDAPSRQWASIREIYTNLMWFSRNTATQLKTRTTRLVDIIIPALSSPEDSKREKIETLQAFIDSPAPNLLTSEHAFEQIAKLKQQLGSFTENLQDKLTPEIANGRDEIAKLEKLSEEQKRHQAEAAHASHGIMGLFSRKPPPEIPVDYETNIKRITDTVKGKEDLITTVQNSVQEICTGLDTIPDRVGSAFSALWLHQKTDAEHLQRAISISESGIVRDVSIAQGAYNHVKNALQYYGTNVTKSGSAA